MEYYQDVLRGLESGSAEYLRQLGRGIEQFDAWRTTLASDEHRYFQNALANEETWERTTQPGKVDSSFDGDVETLSFRIRAMLYDNGVSALFPSQLPCCVDEKQSAIYEASFRQEMVTVEVSKPLRADVDEDYDFDLDDDNEKMPNGDRQSTHEPEIQHQDADEKEEVLDEMEESVILAENSLSRMFHTLEYDRMAMLEQNHLEESDRQVDLEGKQNGRMSDVNFGAASLSLKHLISVIDAKREALAMSDIELRSLISEVRKNRSKWASEERVGQEELYEAAEKVVIELRAYTEHSSAFLNRVSKREAPDYYNIIKYPMDLGTVMKKLKALQYKSKKEFVEDLQIIWQNCLTYNADPNHFLRKHAMAMHKKTLSLIPLIPDITIKERTEMEAENGYALDADGDDSDEEPIVSSRKGPAGSSKTTAKSRTFAPAKTNGDTKPNDQREHSFSIEPFLNAKEEVSSPASTSIAPADLSIILPPELEPPEKPDLDGDLDTGDVEFRNWKSQTKKARAKLAIKRQKLFRGTRLNDDEEALVRTRHGMEEFEELERHHASFPVLLDVDRPQSAHENASAVGTHAIPLLQKMVDYDPCSGIPDNDPSQFARQGNDLEIQPPMSAFTAESRGLINVMNSNIATIQEIRNVCGKIHVIKQMQTSQPMVHSKEKVLKNIDKEISFPAIEIDDRPLSREVSHSILQRSMIRLLCHCGFESSESAALNVLTDLASDYLGKIGKSLSTYLETRRDKFPIQDVSFW